MEKCTIDNVMLADSQAQVSLQDRHSKRCGRFSPGFGLLPVGSMRSFDFVGQSEFVGTKVISGQDRLPIDSYSLSQNDLADVDILRYDCRRHFLDCGRARRIKDEQNRTTGRTY